MTPSQHADMHLDAWFAADPTAEGPTLREHVANAITEALQEQAALYAAGAKTLTHERDRAKAELVCIRAAANGDLSPEKTTETLVREMYHELVDVRFAAEGWKKKAEDYYSRLSLGEKLQPSGPSNLIK